MEASILLIHTGNDQIGWMQTQVWQTIYQLLIKQGNLRTTVDIDKIYTMEFLLKEP